MKTIAGWVSQISFSYLCCDRPLHCNYYYTPVLHHAALQTTVGWPSTTMWLSRRLRNRYWVSFAHNSWPEDGLYVLWSAVSPPDVRSEWWRQLAQQASGVPTKCRLLLCSRPATMTGATAWDLLSMWLEEPHWLQNSNRKDITKDYFSRTRTRTRTNNTE